MSCKNRCRYSRDRASERGPEIDDSSNTSPAVRARNRRLLSAQTGSPEKNDDFLYISPTSKAPMGEEVAGASRIYIGRASPRSRHNTHVPRTAGAAGCGTRARLQSELPLGCVLFFPVKMCV